MLKHIVLLPCRAGIAQDIMDEIFTLLTTIKQALPGVMSLSYGTNQRDLADKHGYTHTYSMDFVDEDYYHHFIQHDKYTVFQNKLKEALAPSSEQLVVNYRLS